MGTIAIDGDVDFLLINCSWVKSRTSLGYLTARNMNEALEYLSRPDVSLVAGGTDWFPNLGEKPVPKNILDITGISELRGISYVGNGWRFGATTRWSDIIHADLPSCFDGLKAAAVQIGSVQIQNSATVVGNICNASPAADGLPPLLALDCQAEITSASGMRLVPLKDFVTGVRQTILKTDEMVTALIIPELPQHTGSSFQKLGSRKYLVISIVMVSAVVRLDHSGHIDYARVAVGACSPVARCLEPLQEGLIGKSQTDLLRSGLVNSEHLAALTPIDDTRGSATFRFEAVKELVQRTIISAARVAV